VTVSTAKVAAARGHSRGQRVSECKVVANESLRARANTASPGPAPAWVVAAIVGIVAVDSMTKAGVVGHRDGPKQCQRRLLSFELSRNGGSASAGSRVYTQVLADNQRCGSPCSWRAQCVGTAVGTLIGLVRVGGALGNLATASARSHGFLRGYVVDVKRVGCTVFNVADSCITVGDVRLLLGSCGRALPRRDRADTMMRRADDRAGR